MNDEQRKKILFIAWDNPSSNYLEGLFVPIFERLSKAFLYEFYVVQFSWADRSRIAYLSSYCAARGVHYKHVKIVTKPFSIPGKYYTLFKGVRILYRFIVENGISTIMPRSTMPGQMALTLKRKMPQLRVIFDADGLPIEERVDFAGLKLGSFRYRKLKAIERQIMESADLVLARTVKAIAFLQQQYLTDSAKLFRVINGRDESFFKSSAIARKMLREKLGIPEEARVCVYCGSLGPQYGVDQMFYIYDQLHQENRQFYFLVITNNPGYLEKYKTLHPQLIVQRADFLQVPDYLSVGDFAFAIRKATFSMQGVAPIKIGEYLLMGLPVIASSGIGDTDMILRHQPFAFVLKSYELPHLNEAVRWIQSFPGSDATARQARKFGEDHFSLKESVACYQNALQKLAG